MSEENKNQIKEKLREHYQKLNSVRRLASETGVSSTYISQILNDKADPADETWNRLANYYKIENKEPYVNVPIKNYRNIQLYCDATREEKIMFLVIGEAGQGKTTSLQDYANTHDNTIYIQAEHEHTRNFLQRLCEKTGVFINVTSAKSVIISRMREKLARMNNPLIIVDECSKLPMQALLYLRDIYWERRHSSTGILLAGVPSLEININKYARSNKRGFTELLDRIQQPILHLKPPTKDEIIEICKANGIHERKYIEYAIKEANQSNSFRSIERTMTNIRMLERLNNVK